MRKLVVTLIVLAVLLAIADRVAVAGVQREIAKQVAAKYDLTTPPTVEIKGIPFLTQALLGRYDEIAVAIGPMTVEDVKLSKIDATLTGVTAPLGDLIQDPSKTDIRAENVTGAVVIPWETIADRAPNGIKIDGAGDAVRVSGTIKALGRSVPVTADMKIAVVSGAVRLTPVGVKVAGGLSVPNPERFISFTVPVKDLPLGLKITGVKTTPVGLAVEGSASDVPLR
ncbi:LmeA family phospholipid-binding protein [Planotetraspora kaengkrachanensis]|uniref:DUF2993 domain-containing protein n=1 Tax=Planotetraspora kaengkrachanensis TaxID=575193 RepID=A0A8J3VB17_9ACTN|nr:DUF2993 domain-containing protein [Planotetraspora kaengkrachanensis]GIG83727.1 hypothetical protein Pka01_68540 [Planotetraspora kaengkrachanensis]